LRDEEFDVCIVLDEQPDASHLYLAGRTEARIRAGYGTNDDCMLLNLHVSPSLQHSYLEDRNFSLARLFGAVDKPAVT